MSHLDDRAREADERTRERHAVTALHAVGRRCGRPHCPSCPPEVDFDAYPEPRHEES